MTGHLIQNTTEADMEFIFSLFEEAIAWQQRHNYPVWKGYDKEVLQRESNEKTQYKIVIEKDIALVFSVMYKDKLIWRDLEKGDALYLHRIVANPNFKGQKLFGPLLNWSIEHAESKGLKFIRMDTWGDDPRLIYYYESFGFRFVENYNTPDTAELPVPHRNIHLALLEFDLSAVTSHLER